MNKIKNKLSDKEKIKKQEQYNNVVQAIEDTLSLLEGEQFQLLDLPCTVEHNHLVIYPLEEEQIYYNLKELDILGLSILENNLISILSEKGIIWKLSFI